MERHTCEEDYFAGMLFKRGVSDKPYGRVSTDLRLVTGRQWYFYAFLREHFPDMLEAFILGERNRA
jgi:hypothetical protein